jgi:hypothetical protein
MKAAISFFMICSIATIAPSQTTSPGQLPHRFVAGQIAKADSVNDNFNFLYQQVMALKTKCDSLAVVAKTTNDSLAVGKAAQKTILDSLNASKALVKVMNDSFTVAKQRNVLPVGTIVASMLDSVSFRQSAGEGWVLADGRSTSAYSAFFLATGKAYLPDLRGRFLRGCDAGSGNDPDVGKRVSIAGGMDNIIGSYQPDEILSHNHSGSTGTGEGSHTHTVPFYAVGTMAKATGNEATWIQGANTTVSGSGAHVHTLSINNTGGTETRPKNIAVYYYIKVK